MQNRDFRASEGPSLGQKTKTSVRRRYSNALLDPSDASLAPLFQGWLLRLAEMGSLLVCLANFSARQAKLNSQGVPKARQKGPEARNCTVLTVGLSEQAKTEFVVECVRNFLSMVGWVPRVTFLRSVSTAGAGVGAEEFPGQATISMLRISLSLHTSYAVFT